MNYALIPPLIVLIVAIIYRIYLPKNINRYYGYRTKLSMKTQGMWNEANRFASNLLLAGSVAYLSVAMLCVIFIQGREIQILISVIFFLFYLLGILFMTERHLKKSFNESGKINEVKMLSNNWFNNNKDGIAIIISIIALLGTWMPFWWTDIRRHDSVDAMIMNFWAEDGFGVFSTDVVYINKGNKPAAITDVEVRMKLRSDANTNPKDQRFQGEWSIMRGQHEPFTLQPGQIVEQSYKIGEKDSDGARLGPTNAIMDCSINFYIVDFKGGFHSVKTIVGSKCLGTEGITFEKEFPYKAILLPSPEADRSFRFPRKI